METISPSQPLPEKENHQSPAPAPASENPQSSSHPFAAGLKPHLVYKCLLNQITQKLKKPLPVYQTQNEGSDHEPRFRSIVWVDGVSYTSSSTFQQRKMSEMDASKLAYIAITQKAKTDALHFVQEDKISCKSIMAEFAAKKNIGKPVYETTELEMSVPVFRSCMNFNGVKYHGDNGKSKKEAEQLVARSVIIKYLDTENGNDMAIIVNSKLRQFHEMNKIQEIDSVLGAQAGPSRNSILAGSGTGIKAGSLAAPGSSLVQDTVVPATCVPQSIIPELSAEPITPVAPFVIQPPTQQLQTEPSKPVVPVVTQPPTSPVSAEPIKPAVVEPPVLTPFPSVVVNDSPIPATDFSSTVIKQPKVEPSSSPQVSVEPIKQAVVEPQVSTTVPCPVFNNSTSPIVSEPMVEVPATNISSNAIQQPKQEVLPDQAMEYIPLVDQTSDKKRSRKSKKQARKKIRADSQIPVVPANQSLPFSSPQ